MIGPLRLCLHYLITLKIGQRLTNVLFNIPAEPPESLKGNLMTLPTNLK